MYAHASVRKAFTQDLYPIFAVVKSKCPKNPMTDKPVEKQTWNALKTMLVCIHTSEAPVEKGESSAQKPHGKHSATGSACTRKKKLRTACVKAKRKATKKGSKGRP